jgi:hypothetical protein
MSMAKAAAVAAAPAPAKTNSILSDYKKDR